MLLQLLIFAFLNPLYADAPRKLNCAQFFEAQDPIMRMAAPLFEHPYLRWGRHMGERVQVLIDEARRQREDFIDQMRAWAYMQKPQLRNRILEKLNEFRKNVPQVHVGYTRDVIPTVPPHGEASPFWIHRMQELRGIMIDATQRGYIGEWIALYHLKGVVGTSLHPNRIFTRAEMERVAWQNDPSLAFFDGNRFGEIDVLFDGGKSIGEIKYAYLPMNPFGEPMKRFKKQAARMARLMKLSVDLGSPRQGYFIFVGVGPSPTQTSIIENFGLKTIHIPFIL